MALDPAQVLFLGNAFDDDVATAGADANLFFWSFFEDTVGDPQPDIETPTDGPQPLPPPACPTITLYDMLPEIVRNNDPDGALKTVLDAADAEYCTIRGDIFKLTQLIDPMQVPDELLPHMAAMFDIRDFDADTNKMLLRQQIASAIASYRLKSSMDALQLALLFLGYRSEIIELYENYHDVAPGYPSAGGTLQRNPAPGRRAASDIIVLVKPIVPGLIFNTAEQERIRKRLGYSLPIYVGIAEVGRFEDPEDTAGFTDTLEIDVGRDESEAVTFSEFFEVFIRALLDDGVAFSDTLEVRQSGGSTAFAMDTTGAGFDTSGVAFDGGATIIRSV